MSTPVLLASVRSRSSLLPSTWPDEFEDPLATCGAAGEVDLDGVRSSEYEPAPGVDADADPPAPEDLGESAEARRVLVQHSRVGGRHTLNTTPRSGMRRWLCVVSRRHASCAVIRSVPSALRLRYISWARTAATFGAEKLVPLHRAQPL